MFRSDRRAQRRRQRQFQQHEFRAIARDGIRLTTDALGYRPYHPLYGLREEDLDILPGGRRPVTKRWEHIAPHLPRTGSALDIGSQHGWFTFKLAEHGLVAIGVEVDEPDLRLAQWLGIYNRAERTSFIRMDVNPETVQSLPSVDVVLCMSVFHHWARLHGEDHAAQIMKGLAERCRDRMFFETGQPDEDDRAWNTRLSFMQPSPEEWSAAFLSDLGFTNVVHLADTRSGRAKSRKKRALMLATR